MKGTIKPSSCLVHAGIFTFQDMIVIAFFDDASRYLLSLGEFDSVTPEYAINTLKEAESAASAFNITIDAVTDRISHKINNEKEKKFQIYLEKKGIQCISSRSHSFKFTRWIREYKKHRNRFKSPKEYATWYNRRIHGSLNLKIGETPEEAFIRRGHDPSYKKD